MHHEHEWLVRLSCFLQPSEAFGSNYLCDIAVFPVCAGTVYEVRIIIITLVREYLKIVLANPEAFRQVLAITFTNKAANEMKERIVKNLAILVEPGKHPGSDTVKDLLPKLAKQLDLSPEQISSRAAAVLRLIMHHYAEFAVSTIDSFTHRVIRTFAHDLKIPLNFEVEMDAAAMLSQAVDILISQVGTDEKLNRVMVDFV